MVNETVTQAPVEIVDNAAAHSPTEEIEDDPIFIDKLGMHWTSQHSEAFLETKGFKIYHLDRVPNKEQLVPEPRCGLPKTKKLRKCGKGMEGKKACRCQRWTQSTSRHRDCGYE
jgi:hypothetical protein